MTDKDAGKPTINVPMPAVGARLGVESARMTGRLWTTLVGYRDGAYLLLETPESDIPVGLVGPFQAEDVLTIRYVIDGMVVGFRAQVIGRIHAPVALTIAAFPRQYQKHALRQSPRLACHLPCVVRIGGHELPRAMLRDVSDHGCQVRVALDDLPAELKEVPADTLIELELEVPAASGGERRREKVEGQVVGFQPQAGVAMIRVKSARSLDSLMEFLSAFTTRIEFDPPAPVDQA